MGGKRPGSGRKAIKIDMALLEKLCTMQCTDLDLAGIFEVNVRTIERHKKKPAVAAVMERGRAKGRVSLRRSLYEPGRQRKRPGHDFPGEESAGLQGLCL
jgi:hypothetical protein